MTDDEVRAQIAAIPRWYHPVEIRPGIVTPGTNNAPAVLEALDLPAGCRGMRALDLGTRDGFFAFELERRCAEVVAIDYVAMADSGFGVTAELLGSRVTYLQRNLYNLTAADLGTFDLVLFLGLIYHPSRSAGRAPHRSRSHAAADVPRNAGDRFWRSHGHLPLMRFFAGSSWARDPTNYWGPNVRCVEEMPGETEFVLRRAVRIGDRCVFACETTQSPVTAYYLQIATGRRAPEKVRP